jgi:hypothetical protein
MKRTPLSFVTALLLTVLAAGAVRNPGLLVVSASGNRDLLNGVRQVLEDSGDSDSPVENIRGTATQHETREFLEIARLWRKKDYRTLTDRLDRTKKLFNRRPAHQAALFYLAMAHHQEKGHFPSSVGDESPDLRIPSSLATVHERLFRKTNQKGMQSAAQELAYLQDNAWDDAWQRAENAFQQARAYEGAGHRRRWQGRPIFGPSKISP